MVYGFILNALLFVLAAALAPSPLLSWRLLAFLFGASTLCWADNVAPAMDFLPSDRRVYFVSLLNGLCILACWWISVNTWTTQPIVYAFIGFSIMAAGSFLRRAAVKQLGEGFVSDINPVAETLQTHGVFRWVRHPSETGLLLCVIGGPLMFGSWLGASVWVAVLVPLSVLRIRLEENRLRDRFGETHSAYAASVGCLVPRIRH